MKKSINSIVAPLLFALLSLGSVSAQEESKTAPPLPENSQQQVTLQLETQEPASQPAAPTSQAATALPKVKELQPRPHGRSRFDPAPAPKPLIEVKRL